MCDPITTSVVGAVAGKKKVDANTAKRRASNQATNVANASAARKRAVGARSSAARSGFSGAVRTGGAARGASVNEKGALNFGLPGA